MENIQTKNVEHGVYFANLEAYNNGRMVGGWLYPLAYDSFDSFYTAIKEVTRNADEVAVHDYDDFPNMGEYPDHDELYDMIHAVENSYLDNEILFKYMANQHDYSVDLITKAEDSFISVYNNWQDFADERADEDILNNIDKNAQQFVFDNFDYESYAHDLKHDFDSFDLSNYSVAIFHQY